MQFRAMTTCSLKLRKETRSESSTKANSENLPTYSCTITCIGGNAIVDGVGGVKIMRQNETNGPKVLFFQAYV